MSFLRSRSEQLADYLRGCIERAELREPLPNLRAWSAQLGVGLHTLETALKSLHQEGVVRVRPRKGVRLSAARGAAGILHQPRVVRWICYGRDFPDLSTSMEVFQAIRERLHSHQIGFSIERCDGARLRFIHRRGEFPQEMYLLASLPCEFERLFADFKRSALIIGVPSAGIVLPHLSIDVLSAIRHAVHMLARRGFSKVTLVIKSGSRQPVNELFRQYCAEVPHPLEAEVVTMPMELSEQVSAAGRFAGKVAGRRGRRGIIAVYSIPASVLMTALMAHGVRVPGEVEVIAINTAPQAVRVFPLPTYYPYPITAFANAVCKAAYRYFERGTLPPWHKTIPLEMIGPSSL